MTTTYFESVNDNNTVQITDQFSNLVLWKKGKIKARVPSGFPASFGWIIQFTPPPSGVRPFIVFESMYNRALLDLGQVYAPTNVSHTVIGSRGTEFLEELTYYIFIPSDAPEINLPGTGLLCLWNEQGKLIFDSDANYLKVLDFYESGYRDNTLKTYPNATYVGVSVSQPQWFVRGGDAGGQVSDFWGQAPITQRNKVQFGFFQFRLTGGNPVPPGPGDVNNQGRPTSVKVLMVDTSHLQDVPYDFDT